MSFEFEMNGKKYVLTKWIRAILVIILLSSMAVSWFWEYLTAFAVNGLLLLAFLQGNKLSDLEDEIKEIKERK